MHLRYLLFLALIFIFSIAPKSFAHPSENQPFECESLLNSLGPKYRDRLKVVLAMGRFQSQLTDKAAIFKASEGREFPRRIHMVFDYKGSLWRSQKWSFGGQDYEFLDVGFKNLEQDAEHINRVILNHVLTRPDTDLELIYDDRRYRDLTLLKYYRWFLHGSVLEKYRQEKPYLTSVDYGNLTWTDLMSGNNDVIAVLKGHSNIISPVRELDKRLAATIQISYFGDRNFFQPSLDGVLRAAGMEPTLQKDRLPFEHRLRRKEAAAFLDEFDINFQKEKVCEFTRYATFMNLPRPVQDRMLFEALQLVLKRGMRTIVVSSDKISERLFRRYGFRRFRQLPTDQQEMPEYLLYLDVRSPLFREFYERMKQSSADVVVDPGSKK